MKEPKYTSTTPTQVREAVPVAPEWAKKAARECYSAYCEYGSRQSNTDKLLAIIARHAPAKDAGDAELESFYGKVVAVALKCDPVPACKRADRRLEPPWEVFERIRQELAEAQRQWKHWTDSDADKAEIIRSLSAPGWATLEPGFSAKYSNLIADEFVRLYHEDSDSGTKKLFHARIYNLVRQHGPCEEQLIPVLRLDIIRIGADTFSYASDTDLNRLADRILALLHPAPGATKAKEGSS